MALFVITTGYIQLIVNCVALLNLTFKQDRLLHRLIIRKPIQLLPFSSKVRKNEWPNSEGQPQKLGSKRFKACAGSLAVLATTNETKASTIGFVTRLLKIIEFIPKT